MCDGENGAEAKGCGNLIDPDWFTFLADVGTFLSEVNFIRVRVNDLVIREEADLFFGESGMETEGFRTPTGLDSILAFNFSNSLIGVKFLAKFMKSTDIASRRLTLGNGTLNFLALEGFRELKSCSLGLPSHSTHDQPFLWQVIWALKETQLVPFDHQCQPQAGPLQAPQNK